jgi:predicted Rossmann-fold nucleotide-binding protein
MSNNIKMAIFSSAEEKINDELSSLCKDIALYLSTKNVEIVTGGSTGIPAKIVSEARNLGIVTTMFSPDASELSHQERFDNHSIDFYDNVVYGEGFTARSLQMITYVDCALVLNGRTGTLSEFTIAIEEGLPVSVITNTGGISDHLFEILEIINKQFPSKIHFGDDYKEQIDLLIQD